MNYGVAFFGLLWLYFRCKIKIWFIIFTWLQSIRQLRKKCSSKHVHRLWTCLFLVILAC